MTRRLVDVAQDVVVLMDDCGTIMGLHVTDLKEGEEIIEPLRDRILGRVTSEDVYDPETGDILVEAGYLIDEETADIIVAKGIDTVGIRSVLTCEAEHGVCSKCYGRNLATGSPVHVGEAVGVMAAQSIGEPGTQLTLRTFHIGGTASRIAAESEVVAKADGIVQFENVQTVAQPSGVLIALRRNGQIKILDEDNRIVARFTVPYGANILIQDGAEIKKGAGPVPLGSLLRHHPGQHGRQGQIRRHQGKHHLPRGSGRHDGPEAPRHHRVEEQGTLAAHPHRGFGQQETGLVHHPDARAPHDQGRPGSQGRRSAGQDSARNLQDAGHHGRSSAGGRAVRGAGGRNRRPWSARSTAR